MGFDNYVEWRDCRKMITFAVRLFGDALRIPMPCCVNSGILADVAVSESAGRQSVTPSFLDGEP